MPKKEKEVITEIEKLKTYYPDFFKDGKFIHSKINDHIEKLFPNNHKFIPIEREIQGVGKIHFTLHDCAKDLFEQLEKDGIIDYLKEIYQLGVVVNSNPTSTHKRWDYVSLQIFILHKLKYSSILTGLNSNKIGKLGVSGESYLQVVILLSNIGSLSGTLSASKAFLDILKSQPDQINRIKLACNQEWHKLIDDCINNFDYYSIKQILAFEYINRKYKVTDIIYQIFKHYLIDLRTDNSRTRLSIILNRIRKLSYIYLDSQSSNVGFRIPINSYLLNIEQFENIFNPNSKDWDSFLGELEHILTRNLYVSNISAYYHKINYDQTIKTLNRHFDKFFNSENSLLINLINSKKRFVVSENNKNNPLIGQMYHTENEFSIFDDSTYEEKVISTNNVDNELMNKYKNFKHLKWITLLEPNKNTIYFTFFFEKKYCKNCRNLEKYIFVYFDLVFSYFDSLKTKSTDSKEFENLGNEFAFKDMSRKALMYFFQMITKYETKKIRYNSSIPYNTIIEFEEFRHKEFSNAHSAPIYSNDMKSLRSILKKMKLSVIKSNISTKKDISNTINLIQKILSSYKIKGENYSMIVSFLPFDFEVVKTNIKLLGTRDNPITRSHATDVDGCVIIMNNNSKTLDVYIVESKIVRKGFKSSVNISFNNFKKCLTYDSLFNESKINENERGGWLKLRCHLN